MLIDTRGKESRKRADGTWVPLVIFVSLLLSGRQRLRRIVLWASLNEGKPHRDGTAERQGADLFDATVGRRMRLRSTCHWHLTAIGLGVLLLAAAELTDTAPTDTLIASDSIRV